MDRSVLLPRLGDVVVEAVKVFRRAEAGGLERVGGGRLVRSMAGLGEGLEEDADETFALLEHFDGCFIRNGHLWLEATLPELRTLLVAAREDRRPVTLDLVTKRSIAFLEAKSGVNLSVGQQGQAGTAHWLLAQPGAWAGRMSSRRISPGCVGWRRRTGRDVVLSGNARAWRSCRTFRLAPVSKSSRRPADGSWSAAIPDALEPLLDIESDESTADGLRPEHHGRVSPRHGAW
jgi:hypothetical protein